ncbi:MAG TPA: hypothetical protein VEA69_05455 [Tepidisphaeraceae bacterium]|nr:hypothetical protein [Tepidisphaeraceae bacterium]
MTKTIRTAALALTLVAGATLTGCSHDAPANYRYQRPTVTDLDPEDRGLQSSEVVEASDLLAMKLLALPQVNQSSRRLTVVFTNMEDQTRSRFFNYNIFLERLKVKLAEQGGDRIAIVTNRDKFYGVRAAELDAVGARERDDFGQGAGRAPVGGPPAANRIQPDFNLTGTVTDLRNRGTIYYHFTFALRDIRSDGGGTEIPLGYEVKVRR